MEIRIQSISNPDIQLILNAVSYGGVIGIKTSDNERILTFDKRDMFDAIKTLIPYDK